MRTNTMSDTKIKRSISLPMMDHLDKALVSSERINEISSLSKQRSQSRLPPKKSTSFALRKPQIQNNQNYVSTSIQPNIPNAQPESQKAKAMTTNPEKKDSDKGNMWKLLKTDLSKYPKVIASYSSFLKHFASVKLDGHKGCKDSKWIKYFEDEGGMATTSETEEKHVVDLSKLFLGLRFAHGTHSKLYHGIYKDQTVAVKIITLPDINPSNKPLEVRLKKQFICEVNILCRLQHENVIKFVAACSKPPVFCIVTEYLAEGSLRSYLHKHEHKSLPLKNVVGFALEIARAMEYVHSQGVIHRDLKPDNILINEDLHMKIADFGVAWDGSECDPLEDDDPGTYRWMAPEMIKHKCYGRKVDVYSFALVLWELVSGSIPFKEMNPIQAAYAVVNKNLRPPFREDCPPMMQALIEQCWVSQPEKRPEFWQIVKVLEQFESSIVVNGDLNLVHSVTFQDPKKGLAHWFQKSSPPGNKSTPKPKFF